MKTTNLERPILLQFFAEWCMPCKVLSPIIDSIETRAKGLIDIKRVDIDTERRLAEEFFVQAVPTLVLLDKHGDILWKNAGVLPEIEILKQIDSLLKEEN